MIELNHNDLFLTFYFICLRGRGIEEKVTKVKERYRKDFIKLGTEKSINTYSRL